MKIQLVLFSIYITVLSTLAVRDKGRVGVRAKFGRGNGAGVRYNVPVPLNIRAARAQRWCRHQRPRGHLPELTMFCAPELSVCGLYDPDTGKIVGKQIALEQSKISNSPLNLRTQGYTKWVVNGLTFWTISEYWINKRFLRLSPEKRRASHVSNRILPLRSIWLTVNHGHLLRVPVHEAKLKGTPWVKEACIPGMGLHYYYDNTKTKCTSGNVSPFAILYHKGVLVGTLWSTYGNYTQDQGFPWFEYSGYAFVQAGFPTSPQCQKDLARHAVALHFWYIDNPEIITCDGRHEEGRIRLQ